MNKFLPCKSDQIVGKDKLRQFFTLPSEFLEGGEDIINQFVVWKIKMHEVLELNPWAEDGIEILHGEIIALEN